MLFQGVGQAGFANAGLPTEQDDLPSSFLRLFPAVREQADFLLASYQRRQRGLPRQECSTLPFTLHVVDGNRRVKAFDQVRAKGLTFELPRKQPLRGRADHDGIRLSYALKTGSAVRRLTQRQLLRAAAGADLANDD